MDKPRFRPYLRWYLCLLLALPVLVFSQTGKPDYGGTVFIGMKGDFDSFNELNAADSDAVQVIENLLFMRLTRLDENLQFKPQLAQSWRFSNGDSVLTYHLRQDVYWTDGRPTTAKDVLFTYKLATDSSVGYPAASRFDMVEDVNVPDLYTVEFHFKKPYPEALFDTQIPILPKHVLERIPRARMSESAFNRHPVGNGPFKLVEWKANQSVVFEANPNFALGRPYLDRVVFVIIPDETVLLTNLLAGVLDVVPALSPLGYRRVKQDPRFRTLRYPGLGYTFIGWNNADPLFTKRVRQALSYAIDKQEIIDTLCDGLAQPAVGPILPFLWAYDKEIEDFPFNLQIAESLLEQEGWSDSDGDGVLDKNGRKFKFTLTTNGGSQLRKDVAVMVQAQLKKIGVQVHVQPLEWNLFIDRVFVQKNFQAAVSGWDTDFTVNPTDLWHSGAIENGYNFVSYRNPSVDVLLQRGRQMLDRRSAKSLWSEFQKTILADAPYTFLFVPDRLAAHGERVRGVKMDVRGFLSNITQWQISAEKRKYHMVKTK